MGLFIGASVLTVLELFDYAYEVSFNIFFFNPHFLSLKLRCNLEIHLGKRFGKGEKRR